MQKTTNLDLNKPEGSDAVNIDDLNENADIIDEKFAGGSAGHKHTGAAGDGAPIPINGIEAAAKTTAGGNQANRLAVTGVNGRVGDAERFGGLTLSQMDDRVVSRALPKTGGTVDGNIVVNGTLRAQQGIDIFLENNSISEDADPMQYPRGVSHLILGSSSGWSLSGGLGYVVTNRRDVSRTVQWFYSHIEPRAWLRIYYQDNGWSEWKEVGGGVKSVQRGRVTLSGSEAANADIPIASVNLNKSFVNITYEGYLQGSSSSHPQGVRAELTSPTNLNLYARNNYSSSSQDITVSWEVIEYA